MPAIEIDTNCEGTGKNRKCVKSETRWSYAVPLEIIYTTPLSNWNPHKIEYKGHYSTPLGMTVMADGRDGSLSLAKAFNGSNSMFYINTPVDFYGNTMLVSGVTLRSCQHKEMLSYYLLLFYTCLLTKLRHCGVRSVANDCVSSYLENRLKYFKSDSTDSTLINAICGVTHGSILNPKGVILYIN